MEFARFHSDFTSLGLRCSGWLYLPLQQPPPPVVVMAHGLGADKNFVLPNYAERFARDGLAVLLFDYRNFGDSAGEPRRLVHPQRHLEDWAAALAHVRGLEEVDGSRVGLWGTSFSGGHVIAAAALDGGVAALSVQVPFVDGLASARVMGLNYIWRASLFAARDLVGSFFGLPPFYAPIAAIPPKFAALNKEDAGGYLSLVPEDSDWENKFPARGLLAAAFYRPLAAARRVNCPALFILAEKDLYVPAAAAAKAAARLPRAEVVQWPIGHFDVYQGEYFEKAVALQTEFLKRNLRAAPIDSGA
ncbi:MAG: alpha/beta hydrolase [Pseudomonadota bacterium]